MSKCYFCLVYHVVCVCVFMVWVCVQLQGSFSNPPLGDIMHDVHGGQCVFACARVYTCIYLLVSVLFSSQCRHTLRINAQMMESLC